MMTERPNHAVPGKLRSMQAGFTMVELLVITAILGVLAAIALPAYTGYVNKARVTLALGTLETVRLTIEAFHVDEGEYPEPPVDFTSTGLDGKGRRVFPEVLLAQINGDLFSVDSYLVAGGQWTLIARAKDDGHTSFTVSQQGISR